MQSSQLDKCMRGLKMNNTIQILRKIVQNDVKRIAFCEKLKNRTRQLRTTSLYQFLGTRTETQKKVELLSFFQALQNLGLGNLVQSSDYRFKFKWKYNPRDVASAALSNTDPNLITIRDLESPKRNTSQIDFLVKALYSCIRAAANSDCKATIEKYALDAIMKVQR